MADINELKRLVDSQISIMDVVEDYGYATRKMGKNVFIRCPFHVGDKNASMSIQPENQIYHCFSCGESGKGAVEFVRAHGLLKNPDYSLTDAILYIIERFDLNLEIENIDELKQKELQDRYTVDGIQYSNEKINVTKYNKILVDLFKIYLLNNKYNSKVQSELHYNYLLSRGLSLEAIHNFEIGFCPMGALEQVYRNTTDIEFKKYLLQSGLISDYRGQITEYFKDRIIFPIKDTKGHILGFTGRTLDPRDAAKYKLSKESKFYKKSDLLYGYDVAKDAIKKTGKVILLEGNMDVVSSHQLGLTNAVGLNGCSISEKQIEIIKNTGANVVLALDNDNAGHKGTLKIAEQLKEEGINVSTIDIDDFNGQFKDNGDILQASLKNEEIVSDFVNKYTSLEKNIFEFKLKYDFFADKPINYNTITQVFNQQKDTMSPGEIVLFKRFVTQNSEFSKEDISDILSSQEKKKDNLYAEIGMMIINPYLEEKDLTDSQKKLVISKIIMNPNKVLSMDEQSISIKKGAINSLISEVVERNLQKVKTQAIKNEISCRESIEKSKETTDKNKIFTLSGYIEAHKKLYQNDSFAGVIRTREMIGDNFVKSKDIPERFNDLCKIISSYPKTDTFENKVDFLGRVANEILCINAFETKGIGKVERIFIESVAKELDIEINYKDNRDLYVEGYKKAVSEILKHENSSKTFANLFSQICHKDMSLNIQKNNYSLNSYSNTENQYNNYKKFNDVSIQPDLAFTNSFEPFEAERN